MESLGHSNGGMDPAPSTTSIPSQSLLARRSLRFGGDDYLQRAVDRPATLSTVRWIEFTSSPLLFDTHFGPALGRIQDLITQLFSAYT